MTYGEAYDITISDAFGDKKYDESTVYEAHDMVDDACYKADNYHIKINDEDTFEEAVKEIAKWVCNHNTSKLKENPLQIAIVAEGDKHDLLGCAIYFGDKNDGENNVGHYAVKLIKKDELHG